jgi:putative lipoprotein
MTVQLIDVTDQNSSGQVIAQQSYRNPGQVPIPFVIRYNPAIIRENRNYEVSVTITDGGRVLFRTTRSYLVITRGRPSTGVQITVNLV